MTKEKFIKGLLKDIKDYTDAKSEQDLHYIELCLNCAWSTGIFEAMKSRYKELNKIK